MMASVRTVQPEFTSYGRSISNGSCDASRSGGYGDSRHSNPSSGYYAPTSIKYVPNSALPGYNSPDPSPTGAMARSDSIYTSNGYITDPVSVAYEAANLNYGSYNDQDLSSRDRPGRISPDSYPEYARSPSTSDTALDMPSRGMNGSGIMDRPHPQRRPQNRDEFDGPHQLLPRPPPEYIAEQERELPHLPTNLIVQEQDIVLNQVNSRLSRCAFDFVAKYQFPIPFDSKMRPVERPEDREWTEWVFLLKRLATRRRIPARVLYNGQIKQFVTILENSLEMRHAARNQSRPLKDDRNILQLISAGVQVCKLLKDASAMDALDQLYVTTEKQIQQRTASNRYRS